MMRGSISPDIGNGSFALAALVSDTSVEGPDYINERWWASFAFLRRRWQRKHGGVWFRAVHPKYGPFVSWPWRWEGRPAEIAEMRRLSGGARLWRGGSIDIQYEWPAPAELPRAEARSR